MPHTTIPPAGESPSFDTPGGPPKTFALLIGTKVGPRVVSLDRAGRYVIGRDTSQDIVIDDKSVSRRHANVVIDGDVFLEDTGSSNGTFVRDRRLVAGERARLVVGSTFRLGDVTCLVQRARTVIESSVKKVEITSATGERSSRKGRSRRKSADDLEAVVQDPQMVALYGLLDTLAARPINVLVLGETGTGKEVFARTLHRKSPRRDKPFVPVNCAALPESMLESELFGYEKGAFTGATQTKIGLMEAAHHGTLFLDEVGDVPLPMQVKLLRAIETRQITRLGSVQARNIDVRLVSATNCDLSALVAVGRFRADLYYRLNGMTILLPPLRARPADIEALVRHLLRRAETANSIRTDISQDALKALAEYDWPGNVRELENVIGSALVFCEGGCIEREHLRMAAPGAFSGHVEAKATPSGSTFGEEAKTGLQNLKDTFREEERKAIVDALAKSAGNQTRAARLLGIARQTLVKKLEQYQLARPRKK